MDKFINREAVMKNDTFTLQQLDEIVRRMEDDMSQNCHLVFTMANRMILAFRHGERFIL